MIHTDLPCNDFSQVFQIVHGLTDIRSYLPEIPSTHVFASGTNFHDRIVPTGTLDLGFSATASQCIEAVACPIEDCVHMIGGAPGERRVYEAKGAEDWQRMLLRRAEELKPGGRLCLFNFGIDEEGRYIGNTGECNMFDTFAESWGSPVDEGTITREGFAYTNFPQCCSTQEQFVAPLQDETGPFFVSGLRLEHVESRVVRCPFEHDFNANHGDPKRFAREYIQTLRSWPEPTFANGLSASRSVDERADIIDKFYGHYQDRLAANPDGHAMDYVHLYLVIRKEG